MFFCPKCSMPLKRCSSTFGMFWSCPLCSGRMVSLPVLHKILPQDIINKIWQRAKSGGYKNNRTCPICQKSLPEVPVLNDEKTIYLDVCSKCSFVWFDGSEYESLPKVEIPKPEEEQLSPEAKKALLLWKFENMKMAENITGFSGSESPEYLHQKILGYLGLPIEYNDYKLKNTPIVTWLIGLAMVVITLFSLGDIQTSIDKFGLIPAKFTRDYGFTIVSSFFLHAGLLHLFGNLYFLLVFGDNVEDVLGKKQYIFLITLAALVGDFFRIIGDPNKITPCVGASAGISGILTYYCLRFPDARMGVFYFIFFGFSHGWLNLNVKTFIVLWIFFQLLIALRQVSGMTDVSALAHLGGVSIGLLFWLSEKRALSKSTSKTA